MTRFSNRLSAVLIGFAANCVLPARLGEFIRANLLGTQEEISGSASFGTIVVERLFDGFTLLIFLYLGLRWTDFPEEWHSVVSGLRNAGLFLLLAYLVLIVFLIGFKYKAKPFLKILARLLFFLPERFRNRIIDIVWNFSLGLVPLKNMRRWTQAGLYSLLLWFTVLLQIFFLEQSVGFTLPLSSTLIVLVMTSFGVMIPSAPGFIGTFHVSVQYSFLFYGIGKEEALSAAIIYHAAVFFPTILFGFVALLLQQISLDKLSPGKQLGDLE
jgi:uncharacterized protein (TIRG00374 family)